MSEELNTTTFSLYPPWHLQGNAFILNYWLTPKFIAQHRTFYIAPSPIGRVVQVILVRYHDSPVGPYNELLILDHPLISKRRLSCIPKIYVSTEASMLNGQHFWGIPKQLAQFEWLIHDDVVYCNICFEQQEMSLCLQKYKHSQTFYVNSHHLPARLLKIDQAWQGLRYQFTLQFRGKLSKLKQASWKNTQDIFPDFSQARYLHSFYVPEFSLTLPKAKIEKK
ncbi:acetoacetate decarboxylase family protein [Acinetobacter sp. BSP-53]|uniref:acetoacetate decarboxylase family protein n=1 Tax=Acinetobacter sp. BSP-53 TaxID=3344662 RepID=UPI0037704C26